MDIFDQVNTSTTQDEFEPMLELTPALVQKRRSQARIIFDRFMRNRTAVAGAAILIFMFLFCFVGPYVTGHNDPNAINVSNVSQTLAGPSLTFPFGTDDVGRDELARAMAGGQVSLLIGLTSMLVAIDFGTVAGGAAITESVFAWPGMGQLFIQSLDSRDYPVLLAMLLLSAVFVVAFNLIADILYGVMDPRIRYS